MAGVLFVVSLPTACYETTNRPVVTEEVIQDPKSSVVNESSKDQSGVRHVNLFESKSPAEDTVEDRQNNKIDITNDATKSLGRIEATSLPDRIFRSKNVLSDLSMSTPAIQKPERSYAVDLEGDNTKTSPSPRCVSASNSTEVLIGDLPGTPGKSMRESEKSLLNIGRKLVTALTPAKGVPTSDAVSTSKPDTTVSLETLLVQVLEKTGVENAVWNLEKSGNFYQVFFSIESGEHCEECLQYLNECGFGFRPNTTVSVIPCTLFYKGEEDEEIKEVQDFSKEDEMEQEQKVPVGCTTSGINGEGDSAKVWNWNKFVASVRARLTVAQVVESVRSNAELTFDFIILLLVAGFVAAMGLVENSSVVLVASMLISPLMGPILAGTFGTVIQDRQLQKIGVFNELVGLALCIIVGFLFGLAVGCTGDHWGYSDASEWPTSEMVSRGVIRSLWIGVLIALPSGAGVALSVLGGNAGSLVGVAISASLLPPAVNAGLLWALAVIQLLSFSGDHNLSKLYVYSDNETIEYATLGAVSLCLTLVNIACIFVAAVVVLKVKEVAPQTNRDDMKRFWKHDIKIARDYNKTMHGDEAKNLGKQLLEELAVMPQDQVEVIVEKATHGMHRFSMTRHISESGVPENKDSVESFCLSSNQHTWTPGTTLRNVRPRYQPETRRKSLSVPSDQDVEDLVYATLTAGSKLGLFRSMGRPSSIHPPYRKISSTSLPLSSTTQIRSPTRPTEPQLGTIRESTSSLFTPIDKPSIPQRMVPTRRFQVIPCIEEDPVVSGNVRRPSRAPLAKSDD